MNCTRVKNRGTNKLHDDIYQVSMVLKIVEKERRKESKEGWGTF